MLNFNHLRELSWLFIEHDHDQQSIYPKEFLNLGLDIINCKIYEEKNNNKIKQNRFFTVLFQGKDIEKIKISHIFHKHSDLIPPHIKNREVPTLLYKRTKNIGCSIFNYKETVQNARMEKWLEEEHTCNCALSSFCDTDHGHIVTGGLRIFTNSKLRSLLF